MNVHVLLDKNMRGLYAASSFYSYTAFSACSHALSLYLYGTTRGMFYLAFHLPVITHDDIDDRKRLEKANRRKMKVGMSIKSQ